MWEQGSAQPARWLGGLGRGARHLWAFTSSPWTGYCSTHPVEFVMRNTNKLIHKEHFAESGTMSEPKKWRRLLLFLSRKKLPKQRQCQDTPQSPGERRGSGSPSEPGPSALRLVFVWLPCVLCPEASPGLSKEPCFWHKGLLLPKLTSST